MFSVFNSATVSPFAFAIFQSVSPDATVIVLTVEGGVGTAGLLGGVTLGVVVVFLTNNVCPGTMTSLVRLFRVFNSATLNPFAFAIFQSVSPDATVIVLTVEGGVGTAGLLGGVTLGVVVVFLTNNVCPGTMTSLVRLFRVFNSATLNPFAFAIFQSVSPDATVIEVVPGVTVGVEGLFGVSVPALFKIST